MRIHRSVLTLLCAGFAAISANSAQASVASDTVDPEHLIAAYHAAVLGHDRDRLAALFVPEGSAWFNVLSDEAYMRVKALKPDAIKLRPGSVQDFLKLVGTSKSQLDSEHSNLQVRGDGAVATVTFDYRFLIDGKEENRGAESWQLVKSADGWRIASIIYSSTPPTSH